MIFEINSEVISYPKKNESDQKAHCVIKAKVAFGSGILLVRPTDVRAPRYWNGDVQRESEFWPHLVNVYITSIGL